MTMPATFYCVTGKVPPWPAKIEQIVGFYMSKQVAELVCSIIQSICIEEIEGGVDVFCRECKHQDGRIIVLPELILSKTSSKIISIIKETLDREETLRLAKFKFEQHLQNDGQE